MYYIIGNLFPFLVIGLIILQIYNCTWAYRDAILKGKSDEYALILMIFIFTIPIFGIIVYHIIRKNK